MLTHAPLESLVEPTHSDARKKDQHQQCDQTVSEPTTAGFGGHSCQYIAQSKLAAVNRKTILTVAEATVGFTVDRVADRAD